MSNRTGSGRTPVKANKLHIAARMRAEARPWKDIARRLKMTEGSVRTFTSEPEWYELFMEESAKVLDAVEQEALGVHREFMTDSKRMDETRQRSADSVLRHAGYTKRRVVALGMEPNVQDAMRKLFGGRTVDELSDQELENIADGGPDQDGPEIPA